MDLTTQSHASLASLYTGPTASDLVCIPEALKTRHQWVLWRGVDKVDQRTGEIKLNKPPFNPHTLAKAKSDDPTTWDTFLYCCAALPTALEGWEHEDPGAYRGGGIGYVFAATDPYAGMDLDHCVTPETGAIAPWAQAAVNALASYTEITPSRTGLHIITEGRLPPTGHKKGDAEMYDAGRFFTMTGWHLPGTPQTIMARQEALYEVHGRIFGPQLIPDPDGTVHCYCPTCDYLATLTAAGICPGCSTPPCGAPSPLPATPPTPVLADEAVLALLRRAANQEKFTRLYDRGDWAEYRSQSEADLGLCGMMAFYTQEPAQLDRLFRHSALMGAKWDEKRGAQTYGARTIAASLAGERDHYTPPHGGTLVVTQAAGAAQQHQNGQAPPPTPAEPPLPLSDYTNALAFVRDHRQDVRYLEAWGKWLHWTNTHWSYEVQGPIMQKAKATIRRLLRRTTALEGEALAAWMQHIKTSLNAGKLQALITLARDEPDVVIRLSALNTHPWLLPCPNGTLDLKTGEIRDPQRADFLTECLTIPYDPTATCPTWEAFLWTIMGGPAPLSDDADPLRGKELETYTAAQTRARLFCDFLQRVLGQCLTGDVSEQDLYIFYGAGANGKSTLLNIILALLGAYAMKGTAELLMTTRNDRHPTERADLYGKRLVATIETQEAGRLNETFIKEATGGDPIRARRMREDFWEFLPSHTMILATNHKPEIRGTDYAIWRRIKLIPFTVTIPDDQQDKSLPEKLAKELPGILTWMVRGCLDWQRHGLRPPQEVHLATAAYKQEQDVVDAFLTTECFRTPTARVSAADLYSAYERWCHENDIEPLKKRAFGIRLGDSGCQPDKGPGGRRDWVGIGLPTKATEDVRYGN